MGVPNHLTLKTDNNDNMICLLATHSIQHYNTVQLLSLYLFLVCLMLYIHVLLM